MAQIRWDLLVDCEGSETETWTTPEGVATSSELPVKDWTLPRTPEVRAEVFMPRWDAREAGRSGGAGRHVPTGLDDLFADTLSQECVGVVETLKETSEEGIPVGSYRLLDPGK